MANFIITSTYGETSLWRYSFALANELARRSHRVNILITGCRHDLESPMSNPALLTWPSVKPKKIDDFLFLHKLDNAFSPDCIIGFVAGINVSMLTGWWDRVPLRLAYYQIISGAVERDTQLSQAQITFQRLRKRLVYKFAHRLIAVSNASAEDLAATYKVAAGKISVLPILIHGPDVFPDEIHRQRKIVCVGRLDHNKGQDVLLHAMPLILQKIPDVKLCFIGDGPSRHAYEKLAIELGVATSCVFMGALRLNETIAHMASSAVLILPTRDDALPLVTIEALSVGTPVIASRVGGLPEIVRDDETGFLISPDDPAALADRAIKVLLDKPLQQRLSRGASIRFEENFSMKNIGWHAEFFEKILVG